MSTVNRERLKIMLGVKEGHTIFCDEDCNVSHHEVLVKLLLCKRNDPASIDNLKQCVQSMVAHGWDKNKEIPDEVQYFRFPLIHWAAVYGKLSVLKWLADDGFDVAATNNAGETALHRLVACQAHERAVDPRNGRSSSRRFSHNNITQMFAKVLAILTDTHPQMLLRYEYTERNTPLQLCLKLLNDAENQRLTMYYETLFKSLCDRLVNLLKLQKLSEEFVRSGLLRKNKNGSTLWHLGACSKSSKVLTALGALMKSVRDLNLCSQNAEGETPSMVALKNSFPQMASLVEDYRLSSTSLVPVVKMEMLTESEQCCCEQRPDVDNDDEQTLDDEPSFTFQDILDRSNSSFMESSPVINASQTPEQSFTEPLRKLAMAEQQKLVLTAAEKAKSTIAEDAERDISADNVQANPTVGPSMLVIGETGKNNVVGELFGELVVEKQIDLCVTVNESHNDSSMYDNHKEMDIDQDREHPQSEARSHAASPQENALPCESHNSYKTCSEIFTPIELPSPPVSESNGCSYETEGIPEVHTPPSVESNVCKGVNVTPVLLIKLLSEPDVSERFQSLLKEVITGDTEKVDLTQSTLQELKSSRLKLENEITSNENSLQDITEMQKVLNKSIEKLQQELKALQQSEETTKSKVVKLKKEKDDVVSTIKECESTCNHLKRRLSDCAGALNGLSPKSQRRC